MRAELREKKGMYGMPNIAKILTGGAGSPVGHIGRLQKIAQQPFKAQMQYYQGAEEFKERRKAGEFKGDPETEA